GRNGRRPAGYRSAVSGAPQRDIGCSDCCAAALLAAASPVSTAVTAASSASSGLPRTIRSAGRPVPVTSSESWLIVASSGLRGTSQPHSPLSQRDVAVLLRGQAGALVAQHAERAGDVAAGVR